MLVATKIGRRLPQETANCTMANFRAWTDRSRANLGVDTLDLVQLHCPPDGVYDTTSQPTTTPATTARARPSTQAQGNASAGSVAPLGGEFTAAVRDLYDRRIRAAVHDRR